MTKMKRLNISYLERHLTTIEIRKARAQTVEQLSIEQAVNKGIDYFPRILKVYQANLEDIYFKRQHTKE